MSHLPVLKIETIATATLPRAVDDRPHRLVRLVEHGDYAIEYEVTSATGDPRWIGCEFMSSVQMALIGVLDRRIEALKYMLSHFPDAEDWSFLAQLEAELATVQSAAIQKGKERDRQPERRPPFWIGRWHYGPTAADPDPQKMWHVGCGKEVLFLEGGYICGCGAQWEER